MERDVDIWDVRESYTYMFVFLKSRISRVYVILLLLLEGLNIVVRFWVLVVMGTFTVVTFAANKAPTAQKDRFS